MCFFSREKYRPGGGPVNSHPTGLKLTRGEKKAVTLGINADLSGKKSKQGETARARHPGRRGDPRPNGRGFFRSEKHEQGNSISKTL